MKFLYWQYAPYVCAVALVFASVLIWFERWKNRIVLGMGFLPPKGWAVFLRRFMLFSLLFLFAALVLRPQIGFTEREIIREGADLVFALDVSLSMEAKDVTPSRLLRAKEAVLWTLDSMKVGRTGLILFAGDSFVQCPLTGDRSAFRMFLNAASYDSVSMQGTNFKSLFETALRMFRKKRLASPVLVVITDGEDHGSNAVTALSELKEEGVAVHFLAVGTQSGAPLPERRGIFSLFFEKNSEVISKMDPGFLRDLAGKSGGIFADITSGYSALEPLRKKIAGLSQKPGASEKIREGKDFFHVPASLVLLFLVGDLFLPGAVLKGRGK